VSQWRQFCMHCATAIMHMLLKESLIWPNLKSQILDVHMFDLFQLSSHFRGFRMTYICLRRNVIALDALGGQNSAYVIDMMRTRRVVVHVMRDATTPAALASSVWNHVPMSTMGLIASTIRSRTGLKLQNVSLPHSLVLRSINASVPSKYLPEFALHLPSRPNTCSKLPNLFPNSSFLDLLSYGRDHSRSASIRVTQTTISPHIPA
jgi:hypothetical protein